MAGLKRSNTLCGLAGVSVLLLAPGLVFSGVDAGSITFTPLSSTATSVPTLGGTLLILLALFLGFIALRSMRNGNGRGSVSSILIGTLALATLLSATGGVSLLTRANAGGGGNIITSPSGQSFSVFSGVFNSYFNDSGVVQQVTSLTLPTGCDLSPTENKQKTILEQKVILSACSLGGQLSDGDSCSVDCTINASDRRLKTDIIQIGEASNGLPLYEFRYRGDDAVYRGVMAQDVLQHTPAAVVQGPEAYLAVNYAMLGLELKRVR